MATADAPTPVPGRASEADRERIARVLARRSIEGRISTDTFAGRIERALEARSAAELDELVADMRTPGPARRVLLGAVTWASRLSGEVQAAWRAPRIPSLALPDEELTIGRATDCDCLLGDDSVSRRHARLRRDGGRWLLSDLGSRNGTRLNGLRITGEVEVRPGDQLSVAGIRYRLRPPR
jgi:hypothetical protein